jgi:hypothetical protein
MEKLSRAAMVELVGEALLAIPLLIAVLVMWYRWMVIARKWCLEHGDLAQQQAEIA